MKLDQRENLIRSYLLGEMAEPDQTAFEQELLADRELFSQVWAIEDEMIDAYARAEMPGAERQKFERHYLASPLRRERLAIAESFLSQIDQIEEEIAKSIEAATARPVLAAVPRSTWLRAPQRWPQLALVVILAAVLLSAGVLLYLERVKLNVEVARINSETEAERATSDERQRKLRTRNQELEKEVASERLRGDELKAELEELRRRSPAIPSTGLSYLLTPATERSDNNAPPVTIPPIIDTVQLLMALESNSYPRYQAKLQTVEGQNLFIRQPVIAKFGRDRNFARLPVAAGELKKGDYIVILFGQTSDDRSEELNRYFFRVA